MWFCSFSKEVIFISPLLDLYLLWPIEYSRGNSMQVPYLGLRKPGTFLLSPLWLFCHDLENMPRWAYWKLRRRNRAELPHHPSQGQTKHKTPSVCINPARVGWARLMSTEPCKHASPPNTHCCTSSGGGGCMFCSILEVTANRDRGLRSSHGKWDWCSAAALVVAPDPPVLME